MHELEPGDDEDDETKMDSASDDDEDASSEADDSSDVAGSSEADDSSDVAGSSEDDDLSEDDNNSIEDEFAGDDEGALSDDDDEGDAFGTERELCSDESCVGLVNAQGICGECGRTSSPLPLATAPRKRSDSKQGEAVDLLHRSLCPDGTCVGLLGPDGRCKECGLVGESVFTDPRLQGLKTPAIAEEQEDAIATGEPQKAAKQKSNGENANAVTSGDFADRRLCPDGACIGVIGPAGTCNECGTVL